MSVRNLRQTAEKDFATLVSRGIRDIFEDEDFTINNSRSRPMANVHEIIERYHAAEKRGKFRDDINPYTTMMPLLFKEAESSRDTSSDISEISGLFEEVYLSVETSTLEASIPFL
jgi:hypothetical protein